MDKKFMRLILLTYMGANLTYAIGGATVYHLASLKESGYTLEDYNTGVIIDSNSPLPPYNRTKEFKATLISGTTGPSGDSQIIFIA